MQVGAAAIPFTLDRALLSFGTSHRRHAGFNRHPRNAFGSILSV
jgi:hypothetical protein